MNSHVYQEVSFGMMKVLTYLTSQLLLQVGQETEPEAIAIRNLISEQNFLRRHHLY